MLNFTFHNPVKIIFGKGAIGSLSNELSKKSRILLTYGCGSIKQNTVYDQVKKALSGFNVIEFGGIEPNPSIETLLPLLHIVREKNIDFLLAVGGGSVLDGTKFIAAAAHFDGDPWEIVALQAEFKTALPFATVLTLPAAGSEMNCGLVISKKTTRDKLGFGNPLLYPKFSILDPTTTYSLPQRQTANGIIDTFIHAAEQYITYKIDAPLQDRISEGILLTLIEEAPKVFQDPCNYAARANLMWCSTMALNNVTLAGVAEDWAAHMLGHEITACFGLDHAQSLAIVYPAVLDVLRERKQDKILQYAERIFGIKDGSVSYRIDKAIAKTRDFFRSLGVKVYLGEYGIDASAVELLVQQIVRHGYTKLGEKKDVGIKETEAIYRKSLG